MMPLVLVDGSPLSNICVYLIVYRKEGSLADTKFWESKFWESLRFSRVLFLWTRRSCSHVPYLFADAANEHERSSDTVEAMIRAHHKYRSFWNAEID